MVVKCKKNYYEILGVSPDSNSDEVKSSYRTLARKYHPDINKAPDSAEKFKDVLEAYEILSDVVKRKQYNMLNGFYEKPKTKTSENFKNEPKNVKNDIKEKLNEQETQKNKEIYPKKEQNKTNEEYRQKFFREKICSILDEISKTQRNEKRTKIREPKNGTDVNTDITITLSEAINGTERLINIIHKEQCPHCNGRRFINGAKCPECEGTGIYETKRKITVKIPAGIKNSTKLRLIGEGNPGFFGGKNGNLYVKIIIKPDENTIIQENNILYKLPITPFEAVLGAKIEIPSINGNVILNIPPQTTSGQQFRISGKGLQTNGKFGDMIVTVEISIPKNLSDDELNLYGKLKKIANTSVRDN